MLRLVLVPVLVSMGSAILLITGVMATGRQSDYPETWLLYDIRHADHFSIYRMNPEDKSTITLKSDGYFFYPVGSPTGSKFAFWGWHHKRWHLYEMRIDGAQTRVVLANQRNLMSHYWSQDGTTIQTNISGGASSSSLERVDGNPIVSPDGEWIAFSSRRAPGGIYLRQRHNTQHDNQLVIEDHQIADFSLSWSPDGQWIAYVSRKEGQSAIYRVRVDGSQVERLTTENLPYRRLSWMTAANLPVHGIALVVSSLALFTVAFLLLTRRRLPLRVLAAMPLQRIRK